MLAAEAFLDFAHQRFGLIPHFDHLVADRLALGLCRMYERPIGESVFFRRCVARTCEPIVGLPGKLVTQASGLVSGRGRTSFMFLGRIGKHPAGATTKIPTAMSRTPA
jgi:hypothetical protein